MSLAGFIRDFRDTPVCFRFGHCQLTKRPVARLANAEFIAGISGGLIARKILVDKGSGEFLWINRYALHPQSGQILFPNSPDRLGE